MDNGEGRVGAEEASLWSHLSRDRNGINEHREGPGTRIHQC